MLVEGNVLTQVDTSRPVISVDGNSNTIIRNALQGSSGTGGVALSVNGTGNIIDSTIIKPVFTIGIEFLMDGNFYGDNRVSATTPYDLGGTTQTDWGGNVSF